MHKLIQYNHILRMRETVQPVRAALCIPRGGATPFRNARLYLRGFIKVKKV